MAGGLRTQVGTSWNSFYLGVRWGMGHSTGLFIIAVAFLALKGHMDLEKFAALDGLVGVVMIALGVYGITQVPPSSSLLLLLCIPIPMPFLLPHVSAASSPLRVKDTSKD